MGHNEHARASFNYVHADRFEVKFSSYLSVFIVYHLSIFSLCLLLGMIKAMVLKERKKVYHIDEYNFQRTM